MTSPPGQPALSARHDKTDEHMKLLIVDDSTVIRKLIQKFTGEMGIEIIGEAGDGEQALEIVRGNRPDMVTMDITMPNMDGLTCIDEILKLDDGIKILVVSAIKNKEVALDALERGAQGFLLKPFNENSLKDALQKLME